MYAYCLLPSWVTWIPQHEWSWRSSPESRCTSPPHPTSSSYVAELCQLGRISDPTWLSPLQTHTQQRTSSPSHQLKHTQNWTSSPSPLQTYTTVNIYRVLAHLPKSNSRTFQGFSRTIRRIYKENYIKANRHFYKHKQAKRPPQIQLGVLGELCKLPQRGPGQSRGHKRIGLSVALEPRKRIWW